MHGYIQCSPWPPAVSKGAAGLNTSRLGAHLVAHAATVGTWAVAIEAAPHGRSIEDSRR